MVTDVQHVHCKLRTSHKMSTAGDTVDVEKNIRSLPKFATYLKKLKTSKAIREGWVKRWFVVHDGELAYYDNEKESKKKWSITLRSIKEVNPFVGDINSIYMFQIVTAEKTFNLRARTKREADAWKDYLNEIIKYIKALDEAARTYWTQKPEDLAASRASASAPAVSAATPSSAGPAKGVPATASPTVSSTANTNTSASTSAPAHASSGQWLSTPSSPRMLEPTSPRPSPTKAPASGNTQEKDSVDDKWDDWDESEDDISSDDSRPGSAKSRRSSKNPKAGRIQSRQSADFKELGLSKSSVVIGGAERGERKGKKESKEVPRELSLESETEDDQDDKKQQKESDVDDDNEGEASSSNTRGKENEKRQGKAKEKCKEDAPKNNPFVHAGVLGSGFNQQLLKPDENWLEEDFDS